MGTINVLEAIRMTPSVKVGIMITTDKCYENREQIWGIAKMMPWAVMTLILHQKVLLKLPLSWRKAILTQPNRRAWQKYR